MRYTRKQVYTAGLIVLAGVFIYSWFQRYQVRVVDTQQCVVAEFNSGGFYVSCQ